MKAPRFWETDGLAPTLLAPLGTLYAAATARRVARLGQSVPVPVISVGNLSAGGTGKTPVAMDVLQRLTGRGIAVHAVSRGYGGRMGGPIRVDAACHTPRDVGDEPLLLSAFAPTWVSRDRAAGARAAVEAGAEALVLDDAHQNPALAKDLSIVVVDSETGFGNGRCIPAGPLREPVAAGIARADLVTVLGPPDRSARWTDGSLGIPVAEGQIAPLPTGMDWKGLRVLAFAGIGRPEKFFATLRSLGADIARAVPLSDHQPIDAPLIRRLTAEARATGAQLVCTEKDAVRLAPAMRSEVLTVPVRVSWADDGPLATALDRITAPRS